MSEKKVKTKTTLNDLNDHLFAEMERLGDESLVGEALDEELKRAKQMGNIAQRITENAALVLKAQIAVDNSISASPKMPRILGTEHEV